MTNEGDLKVLAQFESEVEASIVKGMLSANGIEVGVLGCLLYTSDAADE